MKRLITISMIVFAYLQIYAQETYYVGTRIITGAAHTDIKPEISTQT
jgi:hypothetical protein